MVGQVGYNSSQSRRVIKVLRDIHTDEEPNTETEEEEETLVHMAAGTTERETERDVVESLSDSSGHRNSSRSFASPVD